MAPVNATRSALAQNVNDAVGEALLIGFNDDGLACAWYGGHSFSVYDAARDWGEVRAFTSGQLMAISDKTAREGYGYAKERMRSEGFEPVE